MKILHGVRCVLNRVTVILFLLALFDARTTQAAVVWQQGFEAGAGGWTTEGTIKIWEIGEPTFVNGPQPHSGSGVAGTILGGNYVNNEGASLISPEFVVPLAATNPKFSFWQWFDTTDSRDYGQLHIRVNGGAWQALGGAVDRANLRQWTQRVVDLRPYAGQAVQLSFYFYAYWGTPAAGWYIDDVQVTSDSLDPVVAQIQLTVPDTQTVDELTSLNVSVSAVDPDIPEKALRFELLSAPPGATMTTAIPADLIAYDGAGYAPANSLNAAQGGIGWNGSWTGANRVANGGLEFGDLLVSGNRLLTAGNNEQSFRTLSVAGFEDLAVGNSFGRDGTTLWLGFLVRAEVADGDSFAGVTLYDGARVVFFVGQPY